MSPERDEFMELAIKVREQIAKAVFDDKVSTRDIDNVEHEIIAAALRNTHNAAFERPRGDIATAIRRLRKGNV